MSRSANCLDLLSDMPLLTMCVPLQATRMLLASLEYGDDALLGHLFSDCELIGWLTSAPEEVVPTPAPAATAEAEFVAAAEPADGGGGSNGSAAGSSAGGNSGGSGGKFPAGGSTPGRTSLAQSSSKDSTAREAVPAGSTSRPCSCSGCPGSCQLISGILPPPSLHLGRPQLILHSAKLEAGTALLRGMAVASLCRQAPGAAAGGLPGAPHAGGQPHGGRGGAAAHRQALPGRKRHLGRLSGRHPEGESKRLVR